MAVRRSIDLLPEIFKTLANEKFLNATMDQLISPDQKQKINGFVGRQFAPTFKTTDSYLEEPTLDRSNYQLEPGVVHRDPSGNVDFSTNYIDVLNQLKFHGADISNHDRMFKNEYYSWSSFFDFDKFVNFSQYYWLPNGPDSVNVFGTDIETEVDFTVFRDQATNVYDFAQRPGDPNPTLILSRGGNYTFTVNQIGNNFWIQTEPGISGTNTSQPNRSTRDIFGVTNNGDDFGTITFDVPLASAQNEFISMPNVGIVTLATELRFDQIQGRTLTAFLAEHGGIDGRTDIDGKTIVFLSNDLIGWVRGGIFDDTGIGYDSVEFDNGGVVPVEERTGAFIISVNPTTNIIEVTSTFLIPQSNQVSIAAGATFGNRFVYRTVLDKLALVPELTSILDTLYYQDENDPDMIGVIRLVDAVNEPIINVDEDIIGKKTYTTPNGVVFTNGLKVSFPSRVAPEEVYASREFYVDGVGTAIRLTAVNDLITPENYRENLSEGFDTTGFDATGFDTTLNSPTLQDYFTINRSSVDRNAWSRGNRWFHIDVLEQAATLNNVVAILDQDFRAKRPVIEFDADLKLYNYGDVARDTVTLIDTSEIDALSNIEGKAGYFVDGVALTAGNRIIFAADRDATVRERIYGVEEIDPQVDGTIQLHLVPDPVIAAVGDSVIVESGISTQGQVFHYNGTNWILSQQKIAQNDIPLFDIQDRNGFSFSDLSMYPGTNFTGSPLFSYAEGTGRNDTELGFPLQYKSFQNVGDILFINHYENDQFSYTPPSGILELDLKTGVPRKIISNETYSVVNGWDTVVERSKQYQIVQHASTEANSQQFEVGLIPAVVDGVNTIIESLLVFVNNKYVPKDRYVTLTQNDKFFINFNEPVSLGSAIVIRVYNDSIGDLGFYEVPENLENNAQNNSFERLTLGQIRNHVSAISIGNPSFVGTSPGRNNFRDLGNYKSFGGNILQHSAGMTIGSYLLVNENSSYLESLSFVQREYTRFKNKFLNAIDTIDLDFTDIRGSLDAVIDFVSSGKTESFSFFYSDMIGYGPDKNTVTYTITNPGTKTYEITTLFNNTVPSDKSILVYINNQLLILGQDYTFSTERPAIIFDDTFALALNDLLEIIEYTTTNGSFVPQTPTKLGLYPKFLPQLFFDDSYQDPVNVIQGHDGSIFVAYNDSRDNLILEFEKRIYNNLKKDQSNVFFDIDANIPGKFRETDFTLTEFNEILSLNFLAWAGANNVDVGAQVDYNVNNQFTWNYNTFVDTIDDERALGYWRGIYRYFYDTDRPHSHPWEMLGLRVKPVWWETRYGPAPYTAGNLVLWNDLRDGKIYTDGISIGTNFTIDSTYTRTELLAVLPVDNNGQLKPPSTNMIKTYNSIYTNREYVFGDGGPAETSWRRSSEYPFALQQALALTKPAEYFSLLFDLDTVIFDTALNQYINSVTNVRNRLPDLKLSFIIDKDDNVSRFTGYNQFISEFLRYRGLDIKFEQDKIQTLALNLIYRVAGYTDKKYLKVLAEQVSPDSFSENIFITDDAYDVELTKSTPLENVVYSGVIIERSASGWLVSGYDTKKPFFTIIPSVVNNNFNTANAGSATGVVYNDFESRTFNIQYNTEFTSKQQVFDFLISYERYLKSKGFIFDDVIEDLSITRNWELVGKEFLFWSTQNWKVGSVLTLNPASDKIKFRRRNTTIDSIFNSRILDQNFNAIRPQNYHVSRIDNLVTITVKETENPMYLIELNPVQYEHSLIFNNVTAFNDVIYQPEVGSRQFRLKLVGFKTRGWNGTLHPSGFVFNKELTEQWQQGHDYNKGDFVIFKGKKYVSQEIHEGKRVFDFNDWFEVDNIKEGLLPNFESSAKLFETYYDIDKVNLEQETDRIGKGLIGYQKRDYLENLQLDDVSQVKFYQGMIKEKGTTNVINHLIRANLGNQNNNIQFFEDWAFRVGEFGAFGANQVVEVQMDEGVFKENPEVIKFLNVGDENPIDLVGVYRSDLYKAPENYQKNMFLDRALPNLEKDLPNAGHPRLDDIDSTLYNIGDLNTLSSENVGSGHVIWVARSDDAVWNIFRVNETFLTVTSAKTASNDRIVLRTDKSHNFESNTRICVKGVDVDIDGFYDIQTIESNVEFTINRASENLDFTPDGGQILTLGSIKFASPADIAGFDPKYGWQEDDLVWVNKNQNNAWEVRKKNLPWESNNDVKIFSLTSNGRFGNSVAIGETSLFAVGGRPDYNDGALTTFVLSANNDYIENSNVIPTTGLTDSFGFSVTMAQTPERDYIVTGAPDSNSAMGFAFVVTRESSSVEFVINQALVAPNPSTADQFGYDVSLDDDDGTWLYIGAPGINKAYAYKRTTVTTENVLTVAGNGISESFTLAWLPDSIWELNITDSTGVLYMPFVDYTLSGTNLTFTVPVVTGRDYVIRSQDHYKYIDTIIAADSMSGDNFGWVIDSGPSGTQIVIGAPDHEVNAITDAGASYVFDRVVERFIGDGITTVFTVSETLSTDDEIAVRVDGTAITNFVVGSNTITLLTTPGLLSIIEVDVNTFRLVQKNIGDAPSDSAQFGYSAVMCANDCAIFVGEPAADIVNPNTGNVYRYVNAPRVYGTITGATQNPTVTTGNSLRIDNIDVTFTGTTLDNVVDDINNANISMVIASKTTTNELVITSTSVLTDNKLIIAPGVGTGLVDLGLTVYAKTQRITHPSERANENFGKALAASTDGATLVVSSDRSSSIKVTTFDLGVTEFDDKSTKWFDIEEQSGAVYVYEYLEHNTPSLVNPGQFGLVQQLLNTDIDVFDEFGHSIFIAGNRILVGAPASDDTAANGGMLYEFINENNTAGWEIYRSESTKVDVERINKVITYNKSTHEVQEFLDYIDPYKGKILGLASQELAFRTEYDPAHYNVASLTSLINDPKSPWGVLEIGDLWWDLSAVRFLEYEQGEINYRVTNWGDQFPGSSIDVYEWVESTVLPSLYEGSGTPKYPDDSSYVVQEAFDSARAAITTKYYFWVGDKSTVPDVVGRRIPATTVESFIDRPKAQGFFYAAFIDSDAIATYNISQLLDDRDIILSVNYDVIANDGILHTEYQLVSDGNGQSLLPERLYAKFIDSIVGQDIDGNTVPAPTIKPSEKLGVLIRPRQTMFVDRLEALRQIVDYLNGVFAEQQMASITDLTNISQADPFPPIFSGEYDEQIADFETLQFIRIAEKPVGYRILVEADSTIDNLWSIYVKLDDNTWSRVKIQAFDTTRYWDFIGWYATGFNENNLIIARTVETKNDLVTVTDLEVGQLVKINSNNAGEVSVVQLQSDGSFVEVFIDNATIKLNTSLYDYAVDGIGFDNSSFDFTLFSQEPVDELRTILDSIKDDLFINELKIEMNQFWFTIIEYILNEQTYVDWLFKTSFISVLHNLRGLDQFPNFQRDNQDYIRDYISEVKPYRTKLREYIVSYDTTEEFLADITDFDVHSYFDEDLGFYRKPSGEFAGDEILQSQGLNLPWFENQTYEVFELLVERGGEGYTVAPIVEITGGGGLGATGTVRLQGGQIIGATVTASGAGYITTPTVTLSGGNGTGGLLYAQLGNEGPRQFDTTMKFDRISYASSIKDWEPLTNYVIGDLITNNGELYTATAAFTSEATFDATNLIVFSDEILETAADRIIAFYQPSSGMLGRDIAQVQSGTDYPGVKIEGLGFDSNPGFDVGAFDVDPFDNFEIDENGLVITSGAFSIDALITSQYTDATLGTRPEDINVDGGAFVDIYSSHAPEELVPGIVFDTLDMQIYTIASTVVSGECVVGSGFPAFTIFFNGTGSTDTYQYADVNDDTKDVDNIYAWTTQGGTLNEGVDYTVDYTNRTLTLLGGNLSIVDKLYIYAYGNAGEELVFDGSFTGDGIADAFEVAVQFTLSKQVFVLVDGVAQTAVTSDPGDGKTTVTISPVPGDQSHVHIFIFNLDPPRQAFSEINNQLETIAAATPAFPADYTIALDREVLYVQPHSANMIVELNGLRLRPANTVYYVGDGSSQTTFGTPDSCGEDPDILIEAFIQVARIDGQTGISVDLVLNDDYTIGGSTIVDVPPELAAQPYVTYPGLIPNNPYLIGLDLDDDFRLGLISLGIATAGSGYSIDDSLTITGGNVPDEVDPAIIKVVGVSTIAAQDELVFDGVGTNGTFYGGPGVGPFIRSSSAYEAVSVTSHNISYPATIVAGDTIMLHWTGTNVGTTTFPAGWTTIIDHVPDAQIRHVVMWQKATGSETGTFNVATTDAQWPSAIVTSVAGVADPATTPPEAGTPAGATSSAPNSVSFSPSGGLDNYFWISSDGHDHGRAVTVWPANMTGTTIEVQGNFFGSTSTAIATHASNAASFDPDTFAILADAWWSATTIAMTSILVGAPYVAADTITLSDGSVITVDAVSLGIVTDFTITTASTGDILVQNDTLTQTSTTSAAGLGFTLTLGNANQGVRGLLITDSGLWGDLTLVNQTVTGEPNPATPTGGTGSGLTINGEYSSAGGTRNFESHYRFSPSGNYLVRFNDFAEGPDGTRPAAAITDDYYFGEIVCWDLTQTVDTTPALWTGGSVATDNARRPGDTGVYKSKSRSSGVFQELDRVCDGGGFFDIDGNDQVYVPTWNQTVPNEKTDRRIGRFDLNSQSFTAYTTDFKNAAGDPTMIHQIAHIDGPSPYVIATSGNGSPVVQWPAKLVATSDRPGRNGIIRMYDIVGGLFVDGLTIDLQAMDRYSDQRWVADGTGKAWSLVRKRSDFNDAYLWSIDNVSGLVEEYGPFSNDADDFGLWDNLGSGYAAFIVLGINRNLNAMICTLEDQLVKINLTTKRIESYTIGWVEGSGKSYHYDSFGGDRSNAHANDLPNTMWVKQSYDGGSEPPPNFVSFDNDSLVGVQDDIRMTLINLETMLPYSAELHYVNVNDIHSPQVTGDISNTHPAGTGEIGQGWGGVVQSQPYTIGVRETIANDPYFISNTNYGGSSRFWDPMLYDSTNHQFISTNEYDSDSAETILIRGLKLKGTPYGTDSKWYDGATLNIQDMIDAMGDPKTMSSLDTDAKLVPNHYGFQSGWWGFSKGNTVKKYIRSTPALGSHHSVSSGDWTGAIESRDLSNGEYNEDYKYWMVPEILDMYTEMGWVNHDGNVWHSRYVVDGPYTSNPNAAGEGITIGLFNTETGVWDVKGPDMKNRIGGNISNSVIAQVIAGEVFDVPTQQWNTTIVMAVIESSGNNDIYRIYERSGATLVEVATIDVVGNGYIVQGAFTHPQADKFGNIWIGIYDDPPTLASIRYIAEVDNTGLIGGFGGGLYDLTLDPMIQDAISGADGNGGANMTFGEAFIRLSAYDWKTHSLILQMDVIGGDMIFKWDIATKSAVAFLKFPGAAVYPNNENWETEAYDYGYVTEAPAAFIDILSHLIDPVTFTLYKTMETGRRQTGTSGGREFNTDPNNPGTLVDLSTFNNGQDRDDFGGRVFGSDVPSVNTGEQVFYDRWNERYIAAMWSSTRWNVGGNFDIDEAGGNGFLDGGSNYQDGMPFNTAKGIQEYASSAEYRWNGVAIAVDLPIQQSATRDIEIVAPLDLCDVLLISTKDGAEYTINNSDTLLIDSTVPLTQNDKLRIITFSNHDPLQIHTKVFCGGSNIDTVFDTPFDSTVFDDAEGFDGLGNAGFGGQIWQLDRNVTNEDFLWVTLNGQRLHAKEQYEIVAPNKIAIPESQFTILDTDIIVVTSFNETTVQPAIAYRIFNDMINRISYYRIAASKSTTLAQDLDISDDEIVVTDASTLIDPNIDSDVLGVVMIDKERITYWEKTGNVLSNIRRGTAGTGAKIVHAAGTDVFNVSEEELVPGDTDNKTWYNLGASTPADGTGLQGATTPQANFLKDKPANLI